MLLYLCSIMFKTTKTPFEITNLSHEEILMLKYLRIHILGHTNICIVTYVDLSSISHLL